MPEKDRNAPEAGKVNSVGIRLLTAQGDIEKRTTAEEMAAYIMKVNKIAESVFSPPAHKAGLMVQVKSATGKTELQMARQGEIPEDQLQSFYDQVLKLKPLRISQGEVLYQIEFRLEP